MADIKVSELNDGVVDANSYLLESNTSVSYKVKASDIGTFVNESQADYSLNTTANTIVGAINETATAAGTTYDNTSSGLSATEVQSAIDELGTVTTGTVSWTSSLVSGSTTINNWYKIGRLAIVHLEFTPISIDNASVIASGLPGALTNYTVFNGNSLQLAVTMGGSLRYYFPSDKTTLNRVDVTLVYITA